MKENFGLLSLEKGSLKSGRVLGLMVPRQQS